MTSLFEDHLSLDAVVAFADGELSLTAFQRAAAHVSQCDSCAREVAEQTTARQQLRSAACPSIPTGLLDALRSIPVALPSAPLPAGVSRDEVTGRVTRNLPDAGVSPPGRAPFELRDRAHTSRGRGLRLGAGAIVAGLAVGAIAATAITESGSGPFHQPSGPDTAQVSAPMAPPAAMIVAASSSR